MTPQVLLDHGDALRAATQLVAQQFAYDPSRWEGCLLPSELHAIKGVCSEGAIARSHLADFARQAIAQPVAARQLFVATMVWGFGSVGYGPFRTRRMLASLEGTRLLESTVELVATGRIEQAYRLFQVDRCGPAFFTKFFYAIGLGAGVRPLPLILDSRVADALRAILPQVGDNPSHYVRGERAVQRYPAGYVRFVGLLNGWASELGCRPDAIEHFLFDPPVGAIPAADE